MFNSIRSELNNTLQNGMIATLTLMKAMLLIYEGILTVPLLRPGNQPALQLFSGL